MLRFVFVYDARFADALSLIVVFKRGYTVRSYLTLKKVFSDGKIESHDGSGESGSKCFNGLQESETQGDGRDGQCKTVYVVDWLTNTRDQV